MDNRIVFVIDDDAEICQSLRWLFESVSLVVETYQNAQVFLNNYNSNWQGCIICDVRMPHMSGLELLDELKVLKNRLPVILFSGYGDIPMAVRAIKAGAVDFLTKPLNEQLLLELVQKNLKTPSAKETKLLNESNEHIKHLTQREREVLMLVIEGKLNKEIADQLSISMSTVEAHRARIMRKMRVRNLAQLIKACLSKFSS